MMQRIFLLKILCILTGALYPVYGWVLQAGPTTSNLTPTSVTISWTSSIPMPSRVVYGYGFREFSSESPADPTPRTQHQVTLTGLIPDWVLNYQMLSGTSQGAETTENFTLLIPPPNAGPTDFKLRTVGAHQLHPGHSSYGWLHIIRLMGNADVCFLGYTPLPAGVSVEFYSPIGNINPVTPSGRQPVDQSRPYYYAVHDRNPDIRFTVAASAAPGTYSFTIYVEMGGVRREIPYALTIAPVPAWTRRAISSIPPVPDRTKWEENMLTFGQTYCTPPEEDRLWEGNVWYYDGQRAYYQIADYTNNPAKWTPCAHYAGDIYRDYVISNKARIPAHRIFPHGLTLAIDRENDAAARQAFEWLLTGGGFSSVGPGSMRETAYYLQLHTLGAARGLENWDKADQAMDALVAQVDQLFISRTEKFYLPFWCALAADALQEYYLYRKDERVPYLLKTIADNLWNEAWIPADNGFFYHSVDGRTGGTPDLNLLFASQFTWLWATTGDDLYREKADLLFDKGVTNAWLGKGKHFSQHYRLSFKYVNWRTDPASLDTVPTTPIAMIGVSVASLRVFPNPWKSSKHGSLPITFDTFDQPGTLKIFTVSGHLVRELRYSPPSIPWDRRNQNGDRVASGIYLFVLRGEDGQERRGKLAIAQ